MNHDDNKPNIQPLIETELEARVVAWVSGEASAFEAAELERLIGEKPELGIFKRRIEAVRGLVAEAIRPDQQPLLLSPGRRAKLLQAIGAPEAAAPATVPSSSVIQPLAATKRAQRKDRRWMLALAACLTVGLFTVLSIPSFKKYRPAENMAKLVPPADSELREESVPVNLPVAASAYPVSVAVADSSTRLQGRASREVAVREAAIKQAGESQSRRRAGGGAADLNWSAREAAQRQAMTDGRARSNNGMSPAPAPVMNFRLSNGVAGYAAATTLAGNRLSTELKDVGSAVTVVTGQFLKDTGASRLRDSSNYATGTEVGDGSTIHSYIDGNTSNLSLANAATASGHVTGAMITPRLPSFGRKEDEVISLSPFEVSAGRDKGGPVAITISGVAGTRVTRSYGVDAIKKSGDREDDDAKVAPAAPKPAAAPSFPEVSTAQEPVSTFSLHVSDVSFRLAQAALAKDEALDRERIRPEEFYNAFDYGDPTPALAEKVSCRIEQAAHPFLQQRNLVRVALKVAASGRDAAQPLRLTVLLDTSGSMEREDRVAIVQRAMASLLSLLGPNDRLTLIGFARQPRLLAESLPGDKSGQVLEIMAHTPAEGGTNLEEALNLGGELARRQFEPAAQNRIVLLTDGAANLGNANPAQLAAAIGALRQQGIAFDACGVGLEGLDDAMLETLTRKGDGRYYVLNAPDAADANFAQQLAGAFRPAAENVKLQVRFNPARVGHYRLIGFEQHRLREEDFRNDRVDAAELAAEEAAVAVYQVEALPQGEGELGEIYVRFRDAASGEMVERSWTLAYDAHSPAFDRASPSMQLAGSAALFAEILRGEEPDAATRLGELVPVMNRLRNHYASEPRVQEFVTMFEQARRLAGK